MKKRPIQIQSEFFEHVWERSDLDAVFKYFDGEAGGLGGAEPLDPVGYIDFYHALSSVVKDVKFEITDWVEQDDRLFLDFVMKARARRRDKAVFWHGSAWGHYRDGKIAGGDNFLDFMDLFRQLELVPEQAVELGLAGQEILQIESAEDTLGREFRRLFWPNFEPASPHTRLLLSTGVGADRVPSDQQMQVLFQSATFGMVATDAEDRILETNRAFKDILLTEEMGVESFSELLVGKGVEAEKRARAALIKGEIPSYRILLHLLGAEGPVRAWVSAVTFQSEEKGTVLLRSVQRDELIDDLLAMQESERRQVRHDIGEEILQPILDLWKLLAPQSRISETVVEKCKSLTAELGRDLRAKVSALRNPILSGTPLSVAWTELELPPSLDEAGETTSLLTYRIVSECVSHLGAQLADVELDLSEGWVVGKLPLGVEPDEERLSLLRGLCHLIGGRFYREESTLCFELPACSGR